MVVCRRDALLPKTAAVRDWRLWAAAGAMAAVAWSPLGTWTIERLWDVLAGPSWALGNPDSYRGEFPVDVTGLLVAYQLLIRIPLTVMTEEVLFRGWLQPLWRRETCGRVSPFTTSATPRTCSAPRSFRTCDESFVLNTDRLRC